MNSSTTSKQAVRSDGRTPTEPRPVRITPGYLPNAEGSALIETGNTHVICAASVELGVPPWMRGKGRGWVTAEYSMLPRATAERTRRERDGRLGGRTQEIQRLIGRSLRAVVDFEKLGEVTITVDCDVLRADGGTRTASITGGYVALHQAIAKLLKDGKISENPLTGRVAAVSVGLVAGRELLDLDYSEDSTAEVDMNVVMTSAGGFVELQGTAEGTPFDRGRLDKLINLAEKGIERLFRAQESVMDKI